MSTVASESSEGTSGITLVGFGKCGTSYQSATPVDTSGSEEQCNLLSFLALAQHLEVDLLPITWQPFLERVGLGGTAELRQSLINLQLSLAFKRVKDSELAMLKDGIIFRRLMAEVSVLGHSAIKSHANIVPLLGLCWHVIKCQSTWKIWPVLVFEKTPFGNLKEFILSKPAQKLGFDEKVHLCAGVATAIRDMHASNIIHGDIKPENILVVKNNVGQYYAQVTDFGYSTVWRKSGRINLPSSPGWTAPEYPRHGGYLFPEAVQMDVFSFGLVCLWLLFFPSENEVPEVCQEALPGVLEDMAREHPRTSNNLIKVMKMSLQRGFVARAKDFIEICQLLGLPNAPAPLLQNNISEEILYRPKFSITNSISQLYRLDFRVRIAIFNNLAMEIKKGAIATDQKQEFEIQLALCYTFGFGVDACPDQAQSLLASNTQKRSIAEEEINMIKESGYNWRSPISKVTGTNSILAIDFKHYYREQGVLENAEANYRREIANLSSILGLDHIILLDLRSDLSSLLREQAKWEETEKLDIDILERSRKVLGNHSASTFNKSSALAATYWGQGQWGKAESLFLEMIDRSEKLWGAEHRGTIVAKSNLASTFREQGKLEHAEKIGAEVYKTCKDKLGRKHPETITAMSNLASTCRRQGDHERAEYYDTKVLKSRRKILGLKHPDTLLAMSHSALTYSEQGSWWRAIELEEVVMNRNIEILGREHPITLTSMGNLGLFLMRVGRWKEAEVIISSTIEAKSRIMGPDHPNVLTTKVNLASIYMQQKRLQESEEMHKEVLATRLRILPAEHPDILVSLHNVADVLARQRRGKEAYDIIVDLYETELRVLGPSHPTTRASYNNLQEVLLSMKKYP